MKETSKELIIEYHKPMSGFVKISSGDEVVILQMTEYDKLPADPGKRKKQLKQMLYGK